ncbi:hypothetical protein L3i22_005630 [Actinoplanes sp. L3-i22]|nr:hypothetical protein L3i22_005630 [Actinoplanes sp. L3-i22]
MAAADGDTAREVGAGAGSAAGFLVRVDFAGVPVCAVTTFFDGFAEPVCAVTTDFTDFAVAADVVFALASSLRARRAAAGGFAPFAGSGEAFVAFAITTASLP